MEDIYTTLSGGKTFTKIDLSNVYLQIPLGNRSNPCVMINTPKGLFHYNCLPFLASAALGIFQRAMDNLFQAMPHIYVYPDNILITGDLNQNIYKTLTGSEKIG